MWFITQGQKPSRGGHCPGTDIRSRFVPLPRMWQASKGSHAGGRACLHPINEENGRARSVASRNSQRGFPCWQVRRPDDSNMRSLSDDTITGEDG